MAVQAVTYVLSILAILPTVGMMLLFGISYVICKPIAEIINLIVKCCFKDTFRRLASDVDTYMANTEQHNSDVIYCLLVVEQGNVEQHFRIWKQLLLTARNSKDHLIADSFQTIPVVKYGYVFKTTDPAFNIENHFFICNKPLKSLKDLEDLLTLENRKDFREKSPKWEMKVFPLEDSFLREQNLKTYNTKCNLILLRMCHSLTDAVSLARTFQHFVEKQKQIKLNETMGKRHCYSSTNYKDYLYNALFFTPLESVKFFFKPDNEFFRTRSESREMYFRFLNPIPLDRVKAISKAANTSHFGIYLSCLAASLRRLLCSKGGKHFDDVFISFPCSYQKTDHPIELSNKFDIVPFWLPITKMTSMERLLEISRRLNGIKNSPMPFFSKCFSWITYEWPFSMQKAVKKWSLPSFYISSIPFFKEPLKFFNDEALQDVLFNVIQYYGNGIIHVVQYTNHIRVCLTVNANLVKCDAEADLIIRSFEQEFQSLEEFVKKKRNENPR